MKRILVTENQYKRLVKNLNEQFITYKNQEDEKDVSNEIMQTLSYLHKIMKSANIDKNIYIEKIEKGVVYLDKSKYTVQEIDLIERSIKTWVSYIINPRDEVVSNELAFNSGIDSDWTNNDVAKVEDDGDTAKVEDDGDTAKVEDDGDTAKVEDKKEDNEIYKTLEACNFGKNSKGVTRKVVLPPAMDIKFYQDILKQLNTKVTCEKMMFFFAWRSGESSKSTYNPFATTYKDSNNEGCYYNCLKNGVGYKTIGCRTCPTGTFPGVKNYKTYESGLNATVKTLTNGRYKNVVSKLKNDNITAIEIASEKSELITWGTGGLVIEILKYNKTLKPKPISVYGGSVKGDNCTLSDKELEYFDQHIKNTSDGDGFRKWVNKNPDILKYVNGKLSDCGLTDGLDPSGSINNHLKIAFKYEGKEWVSLGKPEISTEVKDDEKVNPSPQPKKGSSVTKPTGATSTSLPQANRWGKPHHGYDIVGPYSGHKCLIVCNKPGVITNASRCGGYGNLVEIRHNDGTYSAYAHLHKIHVNLGQTINVGDVIGVEGNTGGSFGRHLHFEERVARPNGFRNRCGEGSPYNEVYGYGPGKVKPISNLNNYFYFQKGE